MTITIERIPRTIQFGDITIEVEELGVTLPFARKPADLSDLGGGPQSKVFVIETKTMEAAEFDEFAANLMRSRDWLKGKGGTHGNGCLCLEVCAPGRPFLYVNPEGGDYARYIARMG